MRRVLMMFCCGLFFAAPGISRAAGGPVPPIQGRGLSVPGSGVSYVAIGSGRDTILRRVARAGGERARSVRLSGRFGVAGVANDGSATGLSADGQVLVLAEMFSSYPQRQTTLVVLDAGSLVARARIALPGFYTVDAISPTGRWLYLIHYVAPARSTLRYEVRALDVFRHQLLRRPVIDPRDRGEAMLGIAITRVTSVDGRWAYTLYDRPGRTPFIHALDTERRAAVCVDLPAISEQDVFSAQLALIDGGSALRVVSSGAPVAMVDTRTFSVAPPGARRLPLPVQRASATPHGGIAWLALVAALVALMGAVVVRVRRGRKTT